MGFRKQLQRSAKVVELQRLAYLRLTAVLGDRKTWIWEINSDEIHLLSGRGRRAGRGQGAFSLHQVLTRVGTKLSFDHWQLLLLELGHPTSDAARRSPPHSASS